MANPRKTRICTLNAWGGVLVVMALTLPLRAAEVFWAGNDALWQQNSNWVDVFGAAASRPAAGDNVFVTDNWGGVSQILLTADTATLNALVVSDGYLLDTNGFRVWVSDVNSADTLISGSSSEIRVQENNSGSNFRSFDTDVLSVELGGWLSMRGGLAEVDDNAEIELGSSITGFGVLLFENAFGSTTTKLLDNNGIIGLDNSGGSGGPYVLELRTSNGGRLDLDGSLDIGHLDARVGGTGTLLINAGVFDPFDGTMFIGDDDTIEFTQVWNLHGPLNMEGVSLPSTLAGAEVFVETGGVVDVADNATAVINAPLTVSFGTAQVGRDAELRLDKESIFGGGGPGQLLLDVNSHLVINDQTTIDHAGLDFNWDGSGETADTTIGPGAGLTIHADRIETGGGSHHGDLVINDGTLEVNTMGAWRKAGQLTMASVTGQSGFPTLQGSPVRLSLGTMDVVGGTALIDVPITIESDRTINVASDAKLNFRQDTTIENGITWHNSGVINLSSATTTISGPTTINGIVDIDGNNGGGTLVIQDVLTLNIDAMEDDAADNFVDNTTVQVGPSGQLNVNLTNSGDFWAIENDSSLQLIGIAGRQNPHVTGNGLANRGQLIVSAAAPVGTNLSQLNFADTGQTTLDNNLHLVGDSIVKAGHMFAGTGALFNGSTATMSLEDGAAVNLGLVNQGLLAVGSSPGIAMVAEFSQSAGGTYEVEIDGTTAGTEYDQLQVADSVQLDGTLDVRLNQNGGTYVDSPVPGTVDEFVLIVAGDLSSSFDDVIYDGVTLASDFGVATDGDITDHINNGLFRIVDYSPTDMRLLNYKALPGDANADGFVDGLDFLVWNSHKFTSGTDWTTGDFNGDGLTDGSDFLLWNSHKFESVPLGRGSLNSMVPEPTSVYSFISGLILLVSGRYRAKLNLPDER